MLSVLWTLTVVCRLKRSFCAMHCGMHEFQECLHFRSIGIDIPDKTEAKLLCRIMVMKKNNITRGMIDEALLASQAVISQSKSK